MPESAEPGESVVPVTVSSILLGSTSPVRLQAWYEQAFDLVADVDGFLGLGSLGLLIVAHGEVAARAVEPGRVLINFTVADAHATVHRLDLMSVSWVAPLEYREDAGAWFATATDPDGNYVQFIEFTADYATKKAARAAAAR